MSSRDEAPRSVRRPRDRDGREAAEALRTMYAALEVVERDSSLDNVNRFLDAFEAVQASPKAAAMLHAEPSPLAAAEPGDDRFRVLHLNDGAPVDSTYVLRMAVDGLVRGLRRSAPTASGAPRDDE